LSYTSLSCPCEYFFLGSRAPSALVLFLILALAQVVLMIVRPRRETHLSTALGMMVEPVVAIVRRILPARRSISELNYLLLTIGILFVLRLLGGYLMRILVGFFHTLPI